MLFYWHRAFLYRKVKGESELDLAVKVANTRIVFTKGDITLQDTGAIVNAANSSLMGGGGVDGAIHRAGGPAILEECKKIVAAKGSCPAGRAVITTGGNLKARYVIHTVGPIWRGGDLGEDELLRQAYLNSLSLAAEHGVKSVAFPAISTGAYRFPKERATRIAIGTVLAFVKETPLDEVRFVLFSDEDLAVYKRVWEEISGKV
ncbi:MAG: O-acetyl-ADP-ribose deacetylase [Ammonifex sp.]|jgi:O-acetyl-ADP-ribose deacetylase (regulator of RNase III)|nr:MAG: O-acetyl-ADP-ribose deacetylase [Ammonifex sp.]